MQLLLGPFEKYFAHYSCCCGPLGKQSSLLTHTHCCCSWRPLWRQTTELWCGSENIIWADNNYFTKNEEYLRAKYFEGGPWKGEGPRQVPRLPSLKHTTVCNPWQLSYMRIWNRLNTFSASFDMRTLSLDVRMLCKQCM